MTDLRIERVFDAPRKLVWRAFTDPDQFAQWFGPVGYSVPHETVEIDLRVGGHQRFVMVPDDPSGHDPGPQDGVITELVPHELLVTSERLEGEMAEMMGTDEVTLRLEFHDHEDGGTRLVLTQGPFPDQVAGGAEGGWKSSFTKLDQVLLSAQTA